MKRSKAGSIPLLIFFFPLLIHLTAVSGTAADTHRFERMWPALGQPWYFFRPYDVAVDGDGYVYVADTHNHRIQKFTSDGHFLTRWGTEGSGDDQFYYPNGICVDPTAGRVYVADTLNYRVKRYDGSGALDTAWAAGGILEDGFDDPYAVAVDGSGYLYVADTGNHRVVRYSPDGTRIASWGGEGASPGAFDRPRGILAAGGFVYVADTGNHRIQKFESDGTFVDAWGEQGREDGSFDLPTDIAADGRGYLYVADNFNDRVQKLTDQGVYVTQWGRESSAPGDFVSPTGIAAFGDYVFVADWNNHRIQKFSRDGVYMAKWASSGSGTGEFIRPRGIALGADGSIYVADTNNHRIQKFDAQRGFLLQWGGEGEGDGELNAPYDVAVRDGSVYVADTLNDRVQVFTTGGAYVAQWGGPGTGDGRFDDPSGIAVDGAGNVYVSDWRNHRIQKFDAGWSHVATWGGYGSGDGQFITPQGLAVSGGFVHVADRDNHRIQKLTTDGVYVDQWGGEGTGDGRFRLPTDVAADPAGNLYVTDTWNHRFQKFDPDGVFLGKHGAEGSDAGQMKEPAAIAAGGDGRVYVADSGNNRIQVFRPVADPADNRAVIVAGGGPYPGNHLWDATQMTANFAYRVLTYQGFDKETIHYLTPDRTLGLDNNGVADDVDGDATNANLETALTVWAAGSENVILFLTDHGKDAVFRMNETETLPASVLDGWLDTLQATISGRVIVVYDACGAGAFLPALAAPDRIVVAGADAGENAWFIGQGSVSFSGFFWTHVFNGTDISGAFSLAGDALANVTALQNPQLDGDGDGTGNDPADLAAASGIRIVNEIDLLNAAPVFTEVMGDLNLSGGDSALLHATVTDTDGIGRVWAVIRPPAFDPEANDTILEFPSVDLLPVVNDRFEAAWDRFDQAGTYQVTFCARDRLGNTATADPVSITIGTPRSQKAVILAGYAQGASEAAIRANGRFAHDTLIFQGYGAGDVSLIYCDETTDMGVLDEAIAGWPAAETRDLVLHLVGEGSDAGFRMSPTVTVTPAVLAAWIDGFQAAIPVNVTVICDFDSSGAFLPDLSRSDRIILTGTSGNHPALRQSEGAVSFSTFFWRRIGDGWSVGHAFDAARDAVNLFIGGAAEGPLLDDDGDAIGNGPGDGGRADGYSLGAGYRRTADIPQVNGVPADVLTVNGDQPVPLIVTDISAADGIERVWAVVSPPGYGGGVQTSAPTTFPLTETANGTYQADLTVAPDFGYSAVAVYARDAQGDVSLAEEVRIFRTDGPDIYEIDDSMDRAGPLVINDPRPRFHSFHHAGDVDWTAFYGVAGMTYEIGVEPRALSHGLTTTMVDGAGNDARFAPLWTCPADGIYHLRVAPEAPDRWVAGGGYVVEVALPVGVFAGFVRGVITDPDGRPIPNAAVTTAAGASGLCRANGRYLMIQEPGTFQITVEAEGYEVFTGTMVVGEGGTTVFNATLTPTAPPPPPPDTIPTARILSPGPDTEISVGETLYFQGAAEQGEAPLAYFWDFDGGAGNSDVPTPGDVTFTRPGTYSVVLTVRDGDGDTASVSVTITVAANPITDLTLDATSGTVVQGESVAFQIDFSGGSPPFSLDWDSDCGARIMAGDDPVTAIFDTPGPCAVAVTVTDAHGETATASRRVTVQEAVVPEPDTAPVASTPLPEEMTVEQGASATFRAEVAQGNPPFSYLWDFGGGPENREGIDAGTVVFDTPGIYPVTFTVTDGDGDVSSVSLTVTVLATPRPLPPVIVSPLDGEAGVSLAPALSTEPFGHTRPEEYDHAGTRWRIASDSTSTEVVLEIRSDRFLTRLPVPALVLEPASTYFLGARFVDDAGNASEWSRTVAFSTEQAPDPDENGDGLPDRLEVDGAVDTDRNGVPDREQAELRCVATPDRGSAVCLEAPDAFVEHLTIIDPETVSDPDDLPSGMIYGLIGFRLTVAVPGETVTVTLRLSDAVPSGTGWVTFDPIGGWRPLPVSAPTDNRTHTLYIADGGPDDADGAANGVIVLASGPGIPKLREISVSGPESGNVGGAGCFIEVLFFAE